MNFMKRIKINDSNNCWEWIAHKSYQGYGRFKGAKSTGNILTHRISWVFHKGELSEKDCVLHKCDNPSCVNPDHLFVGSKADNNKDRALKKRSGLRWKNKEYCKRNHLLSPENIKIRKNGSRTCRLCDNYKSLQRYYKRKNLEVREQ